MRPRSFRRAARTQPESPIVSVCNRFLLIIECRKCERNENTLVGAGRLCSARTGFAIANGIRATINHESLVGRRKSLRYVASGSIAPGNADWHC